MGVVAPNGIGKDAFWQNLIAGKSAVDYIHAFDPSPYPCKVAAEVRDFVPGDFMQPRRAKHRGRFSQFAVAAAKLASDDARVDFSRERPDRVAICIGNSLNGAGDVYDTARQAFDTAGFAAISIMSGVEFAAHAPSSHVSVELGIRGQAATIASACAVGLDTVQWGASRIIEGRADLVVAGATEAPISEFCFATLCAAGIFTKFTEPPMAASRPYDRDRDGMVLGEGAAVYVLEELQHALERGAHIYAEVVGFASRTEGGYGPRTDAAELALSDAIAAAFREAHLSASDLDYIASHGNSLPDYDLVETRAFKRALGPHAYNVPVSSIKSMIGHALAAGSAFQVCSTCLTIKHQIIPPTINLTTPDPECDLDYVPGRARPARVRNALLNAHAMGGSHSVLVLARFDG